jgi:hypothetical protein
MYEVPAYGLKAYALFYSRHGVREVFTQSELDWIVGESMRKKIFSVLLRSGWIKKVSRKEYRCSNPDTIFRQLLDFKVPEIIKQAKKSYAFTGLSAIEIWSDFVYVQRGRERSPYFIKMLKKDLQYWKGFFNRKNIPNYVSRGSTIGEFMVLIPVDKITAVGKEEVQVEPLKTTMKQAKKNEMFAYAYNYMKKKYGTGDG